MCATEIHLTLRLNFKTTHKKFKIYLDTDIDDLNHEFVDVILH